MLKFGGVFAVVYVAVLLKPFPIVAQKPAIEYKCEKDEGSASRRIVLTLLNGDGIQGWYNPASGAVCTQLSLAFTNQTFHIALDETDTTNELFTCGVTKIEGKADAYSVRFSSMSGFSLGKGMFMQTTNDVNVFFSCDYGNLNVVSVGNGKKINVEALDTVVATPDDIELTLEVKKSDDSPFTSLSLLDRIYIKVTYKKKPDFPSVKILSCIVSDGEVNDTYQITLIGEDGCPDTTTNLLKTNEGFKALTTEDDPGTDYETRSPDFNVLKFPKTNILVFRCNAELMSSYVSKSCETDPRTRKRRNTLKDVFLARKSRSTQTSEKRDIYAAVEVTKYGKTLQCNSPVCNTKPHFIAIGILGGAFFLYIILTVIIGAAKNRQIKK